MPRKKNALCYEVVIIIPAGLIVGKLIQMAYFPNKCFYRPCVTMFKNTSQSNMDYIEKTLTKLSLDVDDYEITTATLTTSGTESLRYNLTHWLGGGPVVDLQRDEEVVTTSLQMLK